MLEYVNSGKKPAVKAPFEYNLIALVMITTAVFVAMNICDTLSVL